MWDEWLAVIFASTMGVYALVWAVKGGLQAFAADWALAHREQLCWGWRVGAVIAGAVMGWTLGTEVGPAAVYLGAFGGTCTTAAVAWKRRFASGGPQ